MEDRPVLGFVLLIVFVVVFALVAPRACVDARGAGRVLAQAGYTNVSAGGYGWLSCDSNDVFATRFTATAPNGAKVRGVVCSGIFKGFTIRFK